MKRALYLMPLMAATALTFSLGACDDTKTEDTAAADQTTITAETPAAGDVAATTAPAATINAEGATAYATAPGAPTGAVFLTLHNPGAAADKLVGASTNVAASVEIHESATDANGVATMTKVDALEIPAGQQVSLKPDGYHLMLMGLTAPLAEGTPFDVTLDFENAPDVTLSVTVTAPGATASDATATMDHSTMDHGGTAATPPTDTTTGTTPTDEPMTDTSSSPTDTTAPATDAPAADEQPAD